MGCPNDKWVSLKSHVRGTFYLKIKLAEVSTIKIWIVFS